VKIALLNQFGSRSGAPTGRLAEELAGFLRTAGHDARVISCDVSYELKRRGWRRWAHELKSHLILFLRVFRSGKADAILALTSPVCLPVTAQLAARLMRAKLYLWNMDLYPDVALTLRELNPGFLAWLLRALMGRAYRSAECAVALDEDMRNYLEREYGVETTVVSPWPPDLRWPAPQEFRGKTGKTWLYSGNLGRAHETQTLMDVQKLLEDDGSDARLVLQGGGSETASSGEAAAKLNLKNVVWRGPVDEKSLTRSLLGADVLVVTRKPEMKGLMWPSKLALARLSGRPVLWIGDTDSAAARALREDGRSGAFRPDQKEEIFAWLKRVFRDENERQVAPISPQISRRKEMARWAAILGDGSASPAIVGTIANE
jgi:colanic acid biosynthesis glycosyl transferase WcaI